MGCCGSSDTRESKAEAFKKMAANGNPLAKALKEHWDAYMKEQKYKSQGNTDTYKHLEQKREKKVRVTKSAEESQKAGLDRAATDDIANKFLAYAMHDISTNARWSGNVQFTTNGAAGRDSQMKITGQVEYQDKDKRKCTERYHVVYEFFMA